MTDRVVITAMGAVTSLGNDSDSILANLRDDRTRFQRSAVDPETIACPVESFDLKYLTGACKNRRYLSRGAAFSVGAALACVRQSGLTPEQLSTAGLFVGTGPNLETAMEMPVTPEGRIEWRRTPALWMLKCLANTPAALISQLLGVHGESLSFQTACTAGLTAVGEAFRKIRDGYLPIALAGGGDSRLKLGGLMAYKRAQAIFCGPGKPHAVCRPFDKSRRGFVSGEGGAFFLLEPLSHALARGASIMAEITGFGASMDGHAMTAPEPSGKWAETAVRAALRQAEISPARISVIAAHGTGTLANDAVEAKLLQRVFGPDGPPVTAFKSWIGHLSAACGAAELALGLICLEKGFWPHIRNLDEPCTADINFLLKDSTLPAERLLIENFGFGGQNCALVVEKWSGHDAD